MNHPTTKLDLTSLEKALTSLSQLYQRISDEAFMSKQDHVVRFGLQAGLIQNLEFTYEVCWKMMKRWLETNVGENVEGVTRRELFRMAAENHLIDDVDAWMTFRELRNQTSHRYDSKLAEDAQVLIADFIRAAERLLGYLKTHND
ncbi:MAG: HI0074 family nucleotidyltransferase substrate-binding subunit [Chloroflexota bacterium]